MTTALLTTSPHHEDGITIRPAQQQTRTTRTTAGLGKRAARQAYRWTIRLVITLAALAFGVLAVGPHILDYRTMTMLTGSMTGTINIGDVEIVTPVPVDQVTAGMIIAYHIPVDDHHLVTHRVISVEHSADGAVTVQTKGDANNAPDPWTATLQGDTAYQVQAVIPELGHVIEALRAPIVSQALVYGAPTLLAGWLLLSIWRPTTDDDTEDQQ